MTFALVVFLIIILSFGFVTLAHSYDMQFEIWDNTGVMFWIPFLSVAGLFLVFPLMYLFFGWPGVILTIIFMPLATKIPFT